MRRVLLVLVAVVGSGASYADPGSPDYVDPECANQHFDVWVDYIRGDPRTDDGDPDGNPFTYECVTDEGSFTGTIEHVNAAVTAMGPPYGDRVLATIWTNPTTSTDSNFFTTEDNPNSQRLTGNGQQRRVFRSLSAGVTISGTCLLTFTGIAVEGTTEGIYLPGQCGDGGYATTAQKMDAAIQYELLLESGGLRYLADAVVEHSAFVPTSLFVLKLETVFYDGLRDFSNYPEDYEPPDDPGGGGDDDDDPPPTDPETNCSIIDIPCNLRKLFVPHEEWGATFAALDFSEKLPFAIFSWVPEQNCAADPELPWGGACPPGELDGQGVTLDDTPGASYGGLVLKVPYPRFGGLDDVMGSQWQWYELDLRESEAVSWWHLHGRTWLFWFFVGAFGLSWFKRFVA